MTDETKDDLSRCRFAAGSSAVPATSLLAVAVAVGLAPGLGVLDVAAASGPSVSGGLETQAVCESIDPAWSPDGQWIYFASNCEGNYEIYRMRTDGSEPTRLTRTPGMEHNPRPSPDGRRIAYSYHRQGAGSEIRTMQATGGARTQTVLANGYGNWGPTWSPDGRRIAYESTRDGNADLFVLDLESGSEMRLTSGEARELAPAWSPDGSLIAFQTDVEGDYTIGGVDPSDPSTTHRLVAVEGHAAAPTWSPGGAALVFACVVDGEGDTELCKSRPDGSGLARLTHNEREDFSPSLAPDGGRIVFMAGRPEGGWELRVLSVSDRSETVLPHPR